MAKVLCRFRKDAEQRAEAGGEYYLSTCDINEIDIIADESDEILRNAFGETQCYRTEEGDIYAWWED